MATTRLPKGGFVRRTSLCRHIPARPLPARLLALLLAALATACGGDDRGLIELSIGIDNRSITKIPYFIAWDEGLFEKHGLKVEFVLPAIEGEDDVEILDHFGWPRRLARRLGLERREVGVFTQGGTPMMLTAIEEAPAPHRVAIGATDCAVRSHLIGRRDLQITTLEELKSMRIGATARVSTMGFAAFLFAERMGWDIERDIELVVIRDGSLRDLDAGKADAMFLSEMHWAEAVETGYPVLLDTGEWNEPLAGNSLVVAPEWLEAPEHREAARRLLMAVAEATALYHRDRARAVDVLVRWSGLDRRRADRVYERGKWLPVRPYPCVEGFRRTLALHDSPVVRQHRAEEFYDDSVVREIEASGFFETLH